MDMRGVCYTGRMDRWTDTFALVHADAVSGKHIIENATIIIRNGRIEEIVQDGPRVADPFPIVDCNGKTVGPGLIDMHIHGCGGFDTTQPDLARNLRGMARFLEEHGITSFQLAIAMDIDLLAHIGEVLDGQPDLAESLPGVYPEGPFIAAGKKGGIPLSSIRAPDSDYLDKILSIRHRGAPLVTTMTIAPELEGIAAIRRKLDDAGVVVAWGHSQAYFDQLPSRRSPSRQNAHLTHLYNAMVGLEHRRPGLAILPFLDENATYELICDYVHVDKEMVRFTVERLGADRMCLISDGMSFCGMGKGTGRYLGKDIHSDGKACYYSDDNTLIGSGMLICDTARELYSEGLIDKTQFFEIASTNPARRLKLSDRGSIERGKYADLVLMDNDMHVVGTIKRKISAGY